MNVCAASVRASQAEEDGRVIVTPEVGPTKATLPEQENVMAEAVDRLPPKVIVLPVLAIPVPPY